MSARLKRILKSFNKKHVWAVASLIMLLAIVFNLYRFLDKDNKINVPDTLNVVLISIDTLRADHLSIYGYHRDTTPNLDRFFKDKTIFENAMSPAPCTVPAVLQFLTGTFEHELNKTLTEVLAESGYNTAAIVSQHSFCRTLKKIRVCGRENVQKNFSRGFSYFDIQGKNDKDKHGMTTRTAKELTDKAVVWLENNSNKGKFFLWLHYFDPHDPYEPPQEFRMYDNKNSSYTGGDRRTYLKEAKANWQRAGYIFNKDDVSHFIGLYDGEIKYTDYEIGRVLDKLEKQGLIDNSIIIVIADHGEWLGENNRWDHCQSLHEEEVHVPFLVSVGGKKLGNYGRSDTPVSTLDVFPTVMGLLNIKYDSSKVDGLDLSNPPEDRKVFSVWVNTKVIRSKEWKLFYSDNKVVGLYNIKKDKHENRNLANEEIEIKDELAKDIRDFLGSRKQVEKENKEVIKRLKSLGYL